MSAILKPIYIIWYRDLLRFWRDKTRIIAALAQPLMFLAFLGPGLSAGMGVLGRNPLGQEIDYVKFLYPGIICMTVLFTAMFSAISVVWDREFGFLKEVLVAPISRAAVALGKALGGSTVAMIQGTILLLSPGITAHQQTTFASVANHTRRRKHLATWPSGTHGPGRPRTMS